MEVVEEQPEEKSTTTSSSPKRSRTRSRSPINKTENKYFMILKNVPADITITKLKYTVISSLDLEKVPSTYEIFINVVTPSIHIVRFLDITICENAIKNMNGKEINGNIIEACVDEESQYKKYKWRKMTDNDNLGSTGPISVLSKPKPKVTQFIGGEDTYGLNVSLLKSLDITVLRNRIFIGNLDPTITKEKLRDIFINAGEVINVFIQQKIDTTTARIEFDHPLEAVQAISMFHNKEVNGRPLIVRMDMNKRRNQPEGVYGVGPGLGPGGTVLRYPRVMQEIKSLKESFQRELNTLRNTIQQLKWRLSESSATSKSKYGPRQAPVQNPTDTMNSNTFQNVLAANTFNNQTLNQPMPQNMMQNTNMNMMQNQVAQMYPQANQMGQISGQVNQMPGMMVQANDQMSNQMGLMNQVGQMPGQIGQMSQMANQISQMNQMTSQMGQMTNQMGQMTSQVAPQMAPALGQMGQTTGQIDYTTGQMGYTTGQLDYTSGQMGQIGYTTGQMTNAQMIYQPGQATGQMVQATGQINQMNETQNNSDWAQGKTDMQKSNDQRLSTSGYSKKSYEDRYSEDNYQSSDRESSKGKTSDMLKFTNLPPSVTENVLINKMREVGELKFAELTGNGKAIVRFQNERTAVHCIDLFHRSKVDGKTIDVKFL